MTNTNFPPTHGMDLNENGEWVEVPLENLIPKHLYDALNEEDEDAGITFVAPYLENEFKEWLMKTRNILERSADRYLRDYMSAYESLYEEYGVDLYDALQDCLSKESEEPDCGLCKEYAPEYVKIYVDLMQEDMAENEDAYTKAELLAMLAYHAFIIDVAGTSDKKLIKEKTSRLPDEDEFLSWLEKEYKMDYENARKIVSSIKNMDLILPSLVSEPMTFLDVLRALPAGSKRKNYLKMVRAKKKAISHKSGISEKTISNGLANINCYINFLNSKKN